MCPPRSFLDDRRLTAALVLLAALPVLLVPVAGMVDLPNHMARFRVFLVAGTAGPLDRWFVVQWRWIANLGVDLPVHVLAPLFGVETATRLVVAAIAPLMLLGALALSRAAHGQVRASAMVALALVFAHPWYYGFVNYCLAAALALIVAAAWIARPPARPLPALGFGLGALLVWTAHLGGWVILLLIVAGAELARLRTWRALPGRIASAAPLLLPLAPLLAWRSGGGGRLFSYGVDPLGQKLMAFVTMLTGIGRAFDLGSVVALAALAALALLWAGGRRIEPRLATGAALVTLATLLVPANVMDSWGTDMRMAPVAVMLAILAIGRATTPARERVVAAAGLALFALRDGATIAAWHARSTVLEERLALLDDVPRGSRLGFVSAEANCRTPWPIRPDHVLGAYAVVRRDAFVNTMFHTPGADLMRARDPADVARWTASSQDVKARCPGGAIDAAGVSTLMAAMATDGFERIWLTGATPRQVPPPGGFAVLRIRGGDTLYARAAAPAPGAAPGVDAAHK